MSDDQKDNAGIGIVGILIVVGLVLLFLSANK